MSGTHQGTADHAPPRQPPGKRSAPALLVAFPSPAVLRLPPLGFPMGRKWFAEQGLSDSEISGRHLVIEQAGTGLSVRDLGARNGTWLDGEPLSPEEAQPLEDGSVLRLGRLLLVFRDHHDGAEEPRAALGDLVGPFGLRAVRRTLEAWQEAKPANVLVQGETGTGKELLARAIAAALGRSKPYAAVNVAGVAEGVFESQLFGHVAGAFSDARKASRGIVAAHEGGTVFLDEIGELSPRLQPKLLRLIENREVLAVGAERPHEVDVLLVAATNRDLRQMVEEGSFRRDLHARLGSASVTLPPLRDRAEDVFAILCALGAREGYALEAGAHEVEAIERLLLEPWPNNVRDLLALLRSVRTHDAEPGLRLWAVEQALGPRSLGHGSRLTSALVDKTLAICGGSERMAARRLGVSRGKLRRFLGKG